MYEWIWTTLTGSITREISWTKVKKIKMHRSINKTEMMSWRLKWMWVIETESVLRIKECMSFYRKQFSWRNRLRNIFCNMVDKLTFESLKNHVFLDWVLFMTPKDVLVLSLTCHSMKEILDDDLNVWEHCLSIQPLCAKANRMILPRIQRNRHCLVWHLYIWQKINNATNFIYLLCNVDSYSFSSGLVR